jgi:hypothetical protein
MASWIAADRPPTWLLVAGGLFILCIATGLLVLLFQDLPASARPEVLEEQFKEHLAFLKECALACPISRTPSLPDISRKMDEAAWREYSKALKAWSRKAESRPDLLSHPAILGASVYILRAEGGTRARITIKDYDDDDPSWFESMRGLFSQESREPEVGRPVIRHWLAGKKHVVQYENRFLDPEGVEMGCRLILDLNGIDRKMPSQEP